jgi:capsid protein
MPTREWVNPLQDIKAIREEIDLGITSRTRAAAGTGRNFEDIIDEQVKEEQMINDKRKKAGLVVDVVDETTSKNTK